jgi:hypothetical protein
VSKKSLYFHPSWRITSALRHPLQTIKALTTPVFAWSPITMPLAAVHRHRLSQPKRKREVALLLTTKVSAVHSSPEAPVNGAKYPPGTKVATEKKTRTSVDAHCGDWYDLTGWRHIPPVITDRYYDGFDATKSWTPSPKRDVHLPS